MIVTSPTNDGRTIVIIFWPAEAFHGVRADIEGHFMAALDLAPAFAERVRAGRRSEPFRGTADLPNFFRRPYGTGWALVGDAGYHKHPITAAGIADAFRDAELLAEAVDDGFSGRLPPGVSGAEPPSGGGWGTARVPQVEQALAGYERRRNEASLPLYELTCQLATLQPPPPEMQQLFGALHGNQEQTDRFFGAIAGTVPVPEFFAPENIGRVMAAAGARAA
jgi:flavin-dependent dehydrogenase